MNKNNTVNKFALASIASLMMGGLSSSASAEQFTHPIKVFTAAEPIQTLMAEANSFYNPSMGYNGWLHTSKWGYAKLQKGLPVTITAKTTETNFHPAIAVWLYSGSSKIVCGTSTDQHSGAVTDLSVGEGPYTAWTDFYVKKIKDATGGDIDSSCSKEIGKSLKMTFITNGVDRDGWDAPADFAAGSEFDNTLINRILDGTAGKISVTFTPQVTGIYKFVVGGMNPNAALNAVAGTDDLGTGGTPVFKGIEVSVAFPEK